jgi:hypothetical protein
MKQPTQNSMQDTWGNREFIDSWSSRMDWQKPLREMQMTMVGLMIPQTLESRPVSWIWAPDMGR